MLLFFATFALSPRSRVFRHCGDDFSTLTEANVERALVAARVELSSLFGYAEENRQVGITGEVDFVELSGPSVILRLKGRFWHERTTVLARVASFLQARIPELCDVEIESPDQLDDADPAAKTVRW